MMKLVQAKDISDDAVLAVIRANRSTDGYTSSHHVMDAMPDMPYKVVLAKIASMVKRRVISGCPCGCWSPMWELDADGEWVTE